MVDFVNNNENITLFVKAIETFRGIVANSDLSSPLGLSAQPSALS